MILSQLRYTDTTQYKLHAYVCGPDCVRWVETMGTMTFGRIFVEAPINCRYAVAGTWDIPSHSEKVLVWDLDNVQGKGVSVVTPPPVRTHDDVDAAVISTAMLYDQE